MSRNRQPPVKLDSRLKTYPYRQELRALGLRWQDGVWWASSADMHAQALEVLRQPAPAMPWSLTVHGDAGWKDGLGRWAWFARNDAPPHRLEGVEQAACPNIQEAEGRALLYGLREALRAWTPQPGGVVYLRSDNLAVVERLHQREALRCAPAVAEILALVPAGVHLDARHVPGHGRASGTARWVNERVDAASHLRGMTGSKRLRESS